MTESRQKAKKKRKKAIQKYTDEVKGSETNCRYQGEEQVLPATSHSNTLVKDQD